MNTARRCSLLTILAFALLSGVLLACESEAQSSVQASPLPSATPSTDPTPTLPPAPAPTPMPTADPEAEKRSVLRDVQGVLDEVAPGSAVAVEQRKIGEIRLAGVVAPPAGRDAVIAAILELERVHTIDVSGLVDAAFGPDLVLPAAAGDPSGLSWDPAADFVARPEAANPAPDSYGNPGVWGYLYDESSDADGYARHPEGYVALHELVDTTWQRPGYLYLIVGKDGTPGVMRLHPFGGRVVSRIHTPVLAWTSPISGFVHIIGGFTVGDPSCNSIGTGVAVTIDRGAANLYTAVVDAGDSAVFNLWTRVSAGQSLYVMVDPGYDTACDTTLLRMSIAAR